MVALPLLRFFALLVARPRMYTYNARAHTIVQRYVKFLECARDDAADRKKISHGLAVVVFGRWDSGTMGVWDYAADRKKNSHGLMVSWSLFLDYETVGQWDDGTSRPTNKHSVADTTPFTFHFSLFTFLRTHRSPGGAPPNVRSFVRQERKFLIVSLSHCLMVVVFGL